MPKIKEPTQKAKQSSTKSKVQHKERKESVREMTKRLRWVTDQTWGGGGTSRSWLMAFWRPSRRLATKVEALWRILSRSAQLRRNRSLSQQQTSTWAKAKGARCQGVWMWSRALLVKESVNFINFFDTRLMSTRSVMTLSPHHSLVNQDTVTLRQGERTQMQTDWSNDRFYWTDL